MLPVVLLSCAILLLCVDIYILKKDVSKFKSKTERWFDNVLSDVEVLAEQDLKTLDLINNVVECNESNNRCLKDIHNTIDEMAGIIWERFDEIDEDLACLYCDCCGDIDIDIDVDLDEILDEINKPQKKRWRPAKKKN